MWQLVVDYPCEYVTIGETVTTTYHEEHEYKTVIGTHCTPRNKEVNCLHPIQLKYKLKDDFTDTIYHPFYVKECNCTSCPYYKE